MVFKVNHLLSGVPFRDREGQGHFTAVTCFLLQTSPASLFLFFEKIVCAHQERFIII